MQWNGSSIKFVLQNIRVQFSASLHLFNLIRVNIETKKELNNAFNRNTF